MNKKLQELITQHGGWWHHGDFNMGSSVEFSDTEIEQLIYSVVQECIAVADKTQLVDRQLAVSFALKEHFGVE